MAVVERTIRSLIDDGIARYKEVMTLLAGDMNFLAPGEHRLLIEKPRDLLHARNDHSFHDATWGRIFEGMVELQQQSHTHYDHASLSLSRIDRLYMAAPPWIIANVVWKATIMCQPQLLFDEGISDHAPVLFMLTPPKRKSSESSQSGRKCLSHRGLRNSMTCCTRGTFMIF